jgi:PPM family protein phosphatase
VVAVIQNGYVQWIHSGDSRIYLVRQGKMLLRSRDHSYAEKHIMIRGQADPMNRNILFTCLGSPVAPLFDVSDAIFLHEGDRVLCARTACGANSATSRLPSSLRAAVCSDAVPALVDEALQSGGAHGDNVTVLALDWDTPGDFEPTHVISTDGVGDGVFASTIQAGGQGASLDDFDDAAIERSIAEINEAIRRSAAKKGSPP